MTELALARGFAPEAALGWRDGHPVALRRMLQAAHALAARLPHEGHCINLCEDRLNFIVGFAAALIARSTTVLPHNRAPEVLEELRRLYPGTQTIADHDDAEHAGGLRLDFRNWPGADLSADVPIVPAAHCAAVLFTSGSTGTPQPHRKTWGSLVRAARAAQARLQISAGSVLLGAVPAQHMWGFEMTVMLPLQTACSVDASCPLLPADIAAALARLPAARWLVATPLHLQACLASAQPMPPLAGVLCATATLSTELAQAVEQSWGAPLWEIYGSTETGALATRRPARETQFRAVDGVSLEESDGKALARGGQLDAPVALGDLVELEDATRFELRGRTADLVKVAGKRSSLAALNSELARVPGVRDGVFWLRDGPGEARLAAFAVAPGMSAAQVLAQLRKRVDPVFLPRPLILVSSLPRERTGKLTRESLSELIARHGQSSAPADGSARWQRVPHTHPALPHHFPGDPMVPGVWLLSLVENAARERFGEALRLRGVPEARFRRVLRPGEAYRIELTRVAADRLEFVVESARARIADGTLTVQGAP
jgi:acyl-coenzyme A synthetase/AMP-(fatty) acid ligase/3-hydroxymyristoyl/3-hydroxydecanoyl-(acyl carrier protein) dehydratase